VSARAACLVALAAIACCAPASSARLDGRWVGVRADGVAPDVLAAADAFATETELDFHRNEIQVTTRHGVQSGRYQLLRDDPDRVVIATDRDGPTHPQTFVLIGDDTLLWTMADGKSIVFARE
jgi:hypothetical protein